MTDNEKSLTTSASFRSTFEAAKPSIEQEVGIGIVRNWGPTFTEGGVLTMNVNQNFPTEEEGDEDAMSEPAEDDDMAVATTIARLHMAKKQSGPDEFTFETVDAAFNALKSKLTEVTTTKEQMQAAVAHAMARAANARKIHQHLYAERMMAVAAATALEAQAIALGFNKWIDGGIVDRVARHPRNRHLNMERANLTDFPRAIPNNVSNMITGLMPVFDSFMILFTNPTKERLRPEDKDPILFGMFRAFPNRLYYITDWVDEYCDLTLEKFTNIATETLHDEWKINVSTEVTDADIEEVIEWTRTSRSLDFPRREHMTFFQKLRTFLRNLFF